jgi:[ribosomal protein S18]-alanine N-acetyltransferase
VPYVVQPMQLDDVDEVSRVEKECFTTPWPVNAYRRELRENRLSRYVVVRWVEGSARRLPARAEPEPEPPLAGMRRAVTSLLRPFGLSDGGAGRATEAGAILGFAGMWLMFDEAHITTIGVRQALRGRGVGELMLVHLIDQAQEMGAKRLTLEVRVSNEVAQALYRKYSFREEGVRKRYYSDDGEDALIMWSDRLDDPKFQRALATNRARLTERMRSVPAPDQPLSR